jgi:hypothetical protein
MTEAELSNLLKANSQYNKDLKGYVKGTLPWHKNIDLGSHFGEVSKYIGNSSNLYMSQRIWNKAIRGHSTTIDLKKLEDLPLKIAEAPLVFKSKKPGSIVVGINVTDSDNQPVVVAINTVAKSLDGKNHINLITSIHGRPLNQLELWRSQGLELHNSAQKETFISSKCHGAIPGLEQNKGLKDATNVLQKNGPAKSLTEKMANLTKKNTEILRKSYNKQQNKSHGRGR